MKSQQHYKIAVQKVWDQPELVWFKSRKIFNSLKNYIECVLLNIVYFRYYFPMSENDSFLYNLDETNNSDEESDVQNLTEAV